MTERKPPYGFNSTLRTGSGLPRVNRERRAKRESAGEVYGPHHAYVRRLPCLLSGDARHTCTLPIDGHHVVSVGAGGTDAGNVVPCCRGCHSLDTTSVHVMGLASFQAHWNVNLADIAWHVWQDSPHNPANL